MTNPAPGEAVNPTVCGKTLVLMYHEVHATQDRFDAQKRAGRAYSVMLDQFEQQMAFLAREGYRTLSLDEFLAGKGDERSVVITFDDGHESNLTVATPILQRHDFKAEFFITVDFVNRPRFMSWQQLRELHDAGMSVQSHGLYHQPMTEVPEDQLAAELRLARQRIEDTTKAPVNYFAIPGGFVDERVYRAASSAGFRAVCNSEPALAVPGNVIPRIAIMHSMSQQFFESLVRREPASIFRLQARRKLGRLAKTLVGMKNYEAIKSKALQTG